MNTEKQIWLMQKVRFCLAIALPINLALGIVWFGKRNNEANRKMEKFHAAVSIVRDHYVDGTDDKVGYENLVDGALSGMMQTLDRHSHYLNEEAYRHAQESMSGEFAGIGIVFAKGDDLFHIREVLPGGPAATAGLKADDQICFVDGTDLRGKSMVEASKLLKGEEDSEVTLGIVRPSESRDFEVTVTRQMIKLPTIRNVTYLDSGILYLQITQFNRKTARELEAALFRNSSRMKGLLLDLRNNPGGLLSSAQEISSFFLPARDGHTRRKVVTTIPRDTSKQVVHYVLESKPKYPHLPIAILVNANSASASEIVAGCLKDYKRATVIGARTYGKASVQQEINLGDGTAMRLTTAKYYTPSNVVIHEKGIDPHITVRLTPDQEKVVQSSLMSIVPEPLNADKDPQLAKALEVLASASGGVPE